MKLLFVFSNAEEAFNHECNTGIKSVLKRRYVRVELNEIQVEQLKMYKKDTLESISIDVTE